MKLRPGFVAELAVNFVLPWLAYRLACRILAKRVRCSGPPRRP